MRRSITKSEEYVRQTVNGEKVATNAVEGFFSLIKRVNYGVYHHWSRTHLYLYLTEFSFRYYGRKQRRASCCRRI
jgi:hypothetical protein